MLNKIKNLVKEEQGQGMTEYGLLLAVVVVVVVGALTLFRGTLNNLFTTVGSKISTAAGSVE